MENKIIILVIGIFLISISSFVYAAITWSEETGIEFEITETQPFCDYNRYVWKWWNETTGDIEETNSLKDCFREEGWPSTTCCPEESRCDLSDPGSPNFRNCTGAPSPYFCSNYDNKDDCEGFNYNVTDRSMKEITGIEEICSGEYMESDVRGGKTCYRYVTDCRCVWNGSNCNQQASRTNWTCPGDEAIIIEGNCSFAEQEKIEDCGNSGYIRYTWQALWNDGASDQPGWCEDSTRRFRCGVKLIFFTITSLIIAIAIIIIIYIWIKKRKTKKNKTIKRKRRKQKK